MTKKFICLIFGLLLLICESSLFSFFSVELAKPDLGIPFIIYATFFLSPGQGLVVTIIFGFVQELLSGNPQGAVLFTKIGLLLCCLFLKSRLYIESRYTFSLVCAGAVLMQSSIFIVSSLLAKGETKNIINVLTYSLPNAIMTGFVSLFLFALFEQMQFRYPERY
jgi:rod shape-determining protein MreD